MADPRLTHDNTREGTVVKPYLQGAIFGPGDPDSRGEADAWAWAVPLVADCGGGYEPNESAGLILIQGATLANLLTNAVLMLEQMGFDGLADLSDLSWIYTYVEIDCTGEAPNVTIRTPDMAMLSEMGPLYSDPEEEDFVRSAQSDPDTYAEVMDDLDAHDDDDEGYPVEGVCFPN